MPRLNRVDKDTNVMIIMSFRLSPKSIESSLGMYCWDVICSISCGALNNHSFFTRVLEFSTLQPSSSGVVPDFITMSSCLCPLHVMASLRSIPVTTNVLPFKSGHEGVIMFCVFLASLVGQWS